jgi:hypothetical protein
MNTVELASRILTQLGFSQEPSKELGVDDRRDNIVHLIEEYTHPVKELTISNNEIHKEFLKLIENCDSKLSIGDVGFPALIEDFARAILRKAQEK